MKTEKELKQFWLEAKEKQKLFETLDDGEVVFGARTHGGGHRYEILPVLSDQEILQFEKKNKLELPLQYRTFLQYYGAGGAGPFYGVNDFRKYVLPESFINPFPYSETVYYEDDVTDDDPIWDYEGLAYICDAGCGVEYLLELNGSNPGQIWCHCGSCCALRKETFQSFYHDWLVRIELGLRRYHRLKKIATGARLSSQPIDMSFEEVVAHMQCDYKEVPHRRNEGYVLIEFEATPGEVTLNKEREVMYITVKDTNAFD